MRAKAPFDKMKISVDVETETHSYDRSESNKRHPGKGGLKWSIDVSLEAAPSLSSISEEAGNVVTMTRAPASRTRVSRVSRVDLTSAGAETAIRKLSSTSELIERMGRGRKVMIINISKMIV